MLKATHVELHDVIAQLEQAIHSHTQWHKALSRCLICRFPHDRRDVDKDAHRQCLFGQWYYHHATATLREHPAFGSIESEHRLMHELAAKLFLGVEAGDAVNGHDYECFVNARDRLILQMETLKREMEDALHNQDPLTGAYNRIQILTYLREQQALAQRGTQTCCVVMIDLDNFKRINDTYGHLMGDRVLQAVAAYLMEHLRPYDRLFRYGGEEFLLCLPNTDLNSGHLLSERLRSGLAAVPIDAEGAGTFGVTASFGATALDPASPVEESIDRADKALYAAKSAGRNRTETIAAA